MFAMLGGLAYRISGTPSPAGPFRAGTCRCEALVLSACRVPHHHHHHHHRGPVRFPQSRCSRSGVEICCLRSPPVSFDPDMTQLYAAAPLELCLYFRRSQITISFRARFTALNFLPRVFRLHVLTGWRGCRGGKKKTLGNLKHRYQKLSTR